MPTRLVILDRDGVINHDSDQFIKSPDEWRAIDGSVEAIGRLSAAGFTVVVATNQSGLGRGLIDADALASIHDKMCAQASLHGGVIDHVIFCPHHPNDACECRKPRAGMLRKISELYGVPLDGVPVIGDSLRDLDAAREVNARALLVLTGNGAATARALADSERHVETFATLEDAATVLIAEEKSAV